MSMTTEDPKGFVLTGRHVLAITVLFFLTIFVANGAMLYYAVGSFPGTVTDSSYTASQRYNREIAAAAAQNARGWVVDASARRDADGHVAVRVMAKDAAGQPVAAPDFSAVLQRPTNRAEDHAVALRPLAGATGVFSGETDGVQAGQWELVIEAKGAEGRLFLSQSRLILR
ncbi:FixH family protein [Prosthecomicrobium sp. N25]|uniref:FixH family protein n=1 Tax=Prosthecomicrobium sp. N25 TaxID=3129254 RepID=UPI003076E290